MQSCDSVQVFFVQELMTWTKLCTFWHIPLHWGLLHLIYLHSFLVPINLECPLIHQIPLKVCSHQAVHAVVIYIASQPVKIHLLMIPINPISCSVFASILMNSSTGITDIPQTQRQDTLDMFLQWWCWHPIFWIIPLLSPASLQRTLVLISTLMSPDVFVLDTTPAENAVPIRLPIAPLRGNWGFPAYYYRFVKEMFLNYQKWICYALDNSMENLLDKPLDGMNSLVHYDLRYPIEDQPLVTLSTWNT